RRSLHSGARFSIGFDEAYYAPTGSPFELLSQQPEIAFMKPGPADPAQNYRVVAPDDPLRPNSRCKLLKSPYGQARRRRPGVYPVRIADQSENKVVSAAHIVEFVEVSHKRARIAAPENKSINFPGGQRDPRDLIRVERIGHKTPTPAYPVQKPFRIKSRDVSPAAYAYDHFLVQLCFRN